jgi:hypothetical protein
MTMKFEEFGERLQELKAEFAAVNGRSPETMAEFESFLNKKKIGRIRSTTLRSLKGFDI